MLIERMLTASLFAVNTRHDQQRHLTLPASCSGHVTATTVAWRHPLTSHTGAKHQTHCGLHACD